MTGIYSGRCRRTGSCGGLLAGGVVGAVTLSGMWWTATWVLVGIPGYQGEVFALQAFGVLLGVPVGGLAGLFLARLLEANDGWGDGIFSLTAIAYVALSVLCLWAASTADGRDYTDPVWPLHLAKWVGAIAPVPLWVTMFIRARLTGVEAA